MKHPALIGPTLLEWVGIRLVAENCAGVEFYSRRR